MQTLGQHTLMVSDMPPTPATGGIVLKSATDAMIVVNDAGIYLTTARARPSR